MDSKESWDKYRSPGAINTNEELLVMMQEVVDTIHALDRIYGVRAEIVTRTLINDLYDLNQIAFARELTNYPSLA